MARIPLGALTTLNTSLHLDPQLIELYALRDLFVVSGVNVGLGGAPSAKLTIVTPQGTAPNIWLTQTGWRSWGMYVAPSPGDPSFVIRDESANLDRVRIDTSGSFIVGGTTNPLAAPTRGSIVVNGTNEGACIFTVGGANKGYILANSDTTEIGSVTGFRLATSGAVRFAVGTTGIVTPGADNAQALGSAALRWSIVYSATGAINTSDAREKTAVAPMSDAELRAASRLSREIGSFRWLASIEEKGEDSARLHIGLTVQRAIEVLEEEGLEAARYAFICHDKWQEEAAPANPLADCATTEVEPARVVPAGDRYGFRYDQLAMFILRGQEERLRRLEERA